MARPPRLSADQWAAKNPPRAGETREQYKQRYKEETEPTLLESGVSAIKDVGRGAISGGFSGLGSTVRAIGELTGSKTLRSGGRDMETLADLYAQETMDEPEGLAGKTGRFAGRGAYEVATAMGGAGAVAKGLTKAAPTVARALPRVARGMQSLVEGVEKGGALRRALSTAAINAPVDIVQGVGGGEGMVLPGRTGAVAENILFSLGGGAGSAALDARQAARRKAADAARLLEEAKKNAPSSPIPDPSKPYGPFQASGLPLPPERRLPPRAGPSRPGGTQALPPREPIPMRGEIATPEQRGVALVRGNEAMFNRPATPVNPAFAEAGENVSQQIEAARREFDALPEWQKKMVLEQNMMPENPTDEEMVEFIMRAMMPRGAAPPASAVESAVAAGQTAERSRRVRPAKISGRTRTGEIDPTLLSTLGGSAVGGAVGGLTGDEDADTLGRILAGAMIGGGAGFGASRFFGEGATSRAQQGAAIRGAEESILSQAQRGERPRPTTGEPSATFPDNRRPLAERMNLGSAERMIVEEEIRRVEPTIKRPRTEQELRREAASIAGTKSVDELLDLNPKRVTEAEALGMLNVHKNLREQITARLDAIKQSTDPDEIQRLTAEVDGMDDFATRLVSQIMKADTEAGRALQSRRYMAAQMNNPTYWHIKGTKAKGQFGVLLPAEKAEIDRLVNAGDNEKLLQYMASLQKSSKPEQLAQLRNAGMLTALRGRILDFISTSGNYMSTIAQRYPGALVDAGLARLASSKVGGDAAQFRTVALPTAMELSEAAAGARKGLEAAKASMGFGQKSFKDWVNHIRTAEIDPDMMRQLDLPSVINIDLFGTTTGAQRTANAIADTYSKGIMRLSGVTDKVIRGAALQGALVEQAQLGAMRRNLKGSAADDYVKQALANPDDEMMLNAISAAEYITFTNDGRVADAISGMLEFLPRTLGRNNPRTAALVRAGTRFLVPFRRTPANILSRALEYTPGTGVASIPLAALDWQRELAKAALAGTVQGTEALAKQRKLVDLMTKQATGIGMFTLGAHLYNQGVLTGEFPEDPAEQEQWRTEGKQPESILIGGQWLPISRISPYGGMLTLAASVLKQREDNPDWSPASAALNAGLTTSQSVLNQPMLTGPLSALELAVGRSRDGEATAERFAQNMAGSLVPSFIAQAARAEGVQRQPQSMGEAITSRIPGLQETAPARLNIFGEPVQKAGGLLNTMVNPLTGSPDIREQDPLVAELAKVQANVPAMKRDKKESLEMYQYRQREAGAFVREDLTALVQTEDYLAAPPEEKRKMILDTVQQARRDFARYLKETFAITPEE